MDQFNATSMSTSEMNITQVLNDIIQKRGRSAEEMQQKSLLFQKKLEKTRSLIEWGKKLTELTEKQQTILLGNEGSLRFKKTLEIAKDCVNAQEEARKQYEQLSIRFSRKTVNIGVIGPMGAGKSYMLRSASGLTGSGAQLIPSGDGPSYTGVTSIIENVPGLQEPEVLLILKKSPVVLEEINLELLKIWTLLGGKAEDVPKLTQLNQDIELKNAQDKINAAWGKLSEEAKVDRQNKYSYFCDVFFRNADVWRTLLYDPSLKEQEFNGWIGRVLHAHPELKYIGREGEGAPVFRLEDLARVTEYITKFRPENNIQENGGLYHYYSAHVAIQSAIIRVSFAGTDAPIRLIDTVGIGDSAVDTEARLDRAIDAESDGLILLHPGSDKERDVNISFMNELSTIFSKRRDEHMGEWTTLLVNIKSKPTLDDDWINAVSFDAHATNANLYAIHERYGQNSEMSLAATWLAYLVDNIRKRNEQNGIGYNALHIWHCDVFNTGDREKLGHFLNTFLEHLSLHLSEIDGIRQKKAREALAEAEDMERKLHTELSQIQLLTDNSLSVVSSIMFERVSGMLTEMDNYRQYRLPDLKESPLKAWHTNLIDLYNGEEVDGFSLNGLVKECRDSLPTDWERARNLALERLYRKIRLMSTQPYSTYRNAEMTMKKELAKIFIDKLQIDLQTLSGGSLTVEDTDFWTRIPNFLFGSLSETSNLSDYFTFMDTFNLSNFSTVARMVLLDSATKHLCCNAQSALPVNNASAADGITPAGNSEPAPQAPLNTNINRNPWFNQPAQTPPQTQAVKETQIAKQPHARKEYRLADEEYTTNFVKAMVKELKERIDDIQRELHKSNYNETLDGLDLNKQMQNEVGSFIQCFGEPFHLTWLLVFDQLFRKKAILQAELKELNAVRIVAEGVQQQITEYLQD